jgi:hypothetical protein
MTSLSCSAEARAALASLHRCSKALSSAGRRALVQHALDGGGEAGGGGAQQRDLLAKVLRLALRGGEKDLRLRGVHDRLEAHLHRPGAVDEQLERRRLHLEAGGVKVVGGLLAELAENGGLHLGLGGLEEEALLRLRQLQRGEHAERVATQVVGRLRMRLDVVLERLEHAGGALKERGGHFEAVADEHLRGGLVGKRHGQIEQRARLLVENAERLRLLRLERVVPHKRNAHLVFAHGNTHHHRRQQTDIFHQFIGNIAFLKKKGKKKTKSKNEFRRQETKKKKKKKKKNRNSLTIANIFTQLIQIIQCNTMCVQYALRPTSHARTTTAISPHLTIFTANEAFQRFHPVQFVGFLFGQREKRGLRSCHRSQKNSNDDEFGSVVSSRWHHCNTRIGSRFWCVIALPSAACFGVFRFSVTSVHHAFSAEPIKPNQVPCIKFDDCGVCLGDNSSCTDCAGVVNGDAVVDACGECGGDGSACASLSNGVTTTSFESSAVSASVLSAATTLVAVAAVAVN